MTSGCFTLTLHTLTCLIFQKRSERRHNKPGQYITVISNQHWNGNYIDVDGGIYVDGDIHMNGNHINGTGVILATGDVHLNGNTLYAVAGDEICIYSQGDIQINGNNIKIVGILYAPDGEIRFSGNDITVEGRVIGNTVRFSGNNISIQGNDAALTSVAISGCRLVE